jgi:hypothetical protein
MASRGFREREWERASSGELSLLFPLAVDEALAQKLTMEGTLKRFDSRQKLSTSGRPDGTSRDDGAIG